MIPRTCGKPSFDLRGFVGAVIIENQVDIKIFRDLTIDVVQEGQKLLCTMSSMKAANHFSSRNVKSGEQRGRAMPAVIMCACFGVAKRQWEGRLCAIKRLNLAFFVDTLGPSRDQEVPYTGRQCHALWPQNEDLSTA